MAAPTARFFAGDSTSRRADKVPPRWRHQEDRGETGPLHPKLQLLRGLRLLLAMGCNKLRF